MTNKEKEAIEILKNYDNEDNLYKIHQSIIVVLNLIEKQSKDIEKLNGEKETNQIIYEGIKHKINMEWEHKIKTKIEELNEYGYCEFLVSRDLELTIQILKELIGGIK